MAAVLSRRLLGRGLGLEDAHSRIIALQQEQQRVLLERTAKMNPAIAAFEESPEGAHIHQLVAEGIGCVNQIIHLLSPKADGVRAVDSIERMYTEAEISLFETLTAHTNQAFNNASESSTKWFNTLGAQISENLTKQFELQQQSDMANQEVKGIEQALKAQVEQSRILAEKLAKDNAQVQASLAQLQKAERELQAKKDEMERIRIASLALIWIPIVAATLAIVNATAEQNAVNSAKDSESRSQREVQQDAEVLNRTKAQIQTLQEQMSQAESRRSALQVQMGSIARQKENLELMRDQLVVVKTSVMDCLHTVDAALCSAKVIDNQMSLSNFASSVKGLGSALQSDDAFAGELAQLDEAAFKELDDDIVRIHKQLQNRLKL